MPKSREELEKIIRQLEGVYKITKDAGQKQRVVSHIASVKRELKSLEAPGEENKPSSEAVPQDPKRQDASNNSSGNLNDLEIDLSDVSGNKDKPESGKTEEEDEFPLVNSLDFAPVHSLNNNHELDVLNAVINEFEQEYWGALSDYHLNLDYNHSNKRDAFFNKLEVCKRSIKEYEKILQQSAETNRKDYKAQLQNMASKMERSFIMETVDFFNTLLEFLDILVDDYDQNGNIILNPEDTLEFSKLYGKRKLNGQTVISGVRQTRQLLIEVIGYLRLPSFYRRGK